MTGSFPKITQKVETGGRWCENSLTANFFAPSELFPIRTHLSLAHTPRVSYLSRVSLQHAKRLRVAHMCVPHFTRALITHPPLLLELLPV